ncbi:hypothetical protein PR048_025039 [Dryococelus australis]|uniref:Uncharacterized protein n=1 Tax=Dryococelus australis TaxID=614101 RepID=A0ABQ9GQ96_9NEOP|nr:hypothetical protein PR048_025039 [Dryococelus australis]
MPLQDLKFTFKFSQQYLDVSRTHGQKLPHIFNDLFDVLNSWYPFNTDKSKIACGLYTLEQVSEMDELICLV